MIRITGQIRSTDSVQLDGNYGPYNTTQEAHESLSSLLPPQNKVGVTVGIKDNTTQTIEEYWYQGGTTEQHLVKKQSDGISPDMSFDQKLQAQANLNDTTASGDKMGYKVLQPETEDPTTTFDTQIAGLTNTIIEIRDVYDMKITPQEVTVQIAGNVSFGSSPNNYTVYYSDTPITVDSTHYIILRKGQYLLSKNNNVYSIAANLVSARIVFFTPGEYYIGSSANEAITYETVTPVNMPSDCTLRFNGGMLKNCVLVGNNTTIEAEGKVFDNVELCGTYANDTIKLSWFCNNGDDAADVITSLMYTKVASLFLDNPVIKISHPISITMPTKQQQYALRKRVFGLDGGMRKSNRTTIIPTDDYVIPSTDDYPRNAVFYFQNNEFSTELMPISTIFENISIEGSISGDYKFGYGIYLGRCFSGSIRRCQFYNIYISAIKITGTENVTIENCYSEYCGSFCLAYPQKVNEDNVLNLTVTAANHGLDENYPVSIIKFLKNYSVYSNYGIVAYIGSDAVIDNCSISYTSCYAIYIPSSERLLNLTNSYFEGCGGGNFWIDNATKRFTGNINGNTLCEHLAGSHYGEEGNNSITSGWGLLYGNNKRIRSIIHIAAPTPSVFEANNLQQINISGLNLSMNRTRTTIEDSKIDDTNVTGVGVDAIMSFNNVAVNLGNGYVGPGSGDYSGIPRYYMCLGVSGNAINADYAINRKVKIVLSSLPKQYAELNDWYHINRPSFINDRMSVVRLDKSETNYNEVTKVLPTLDDTSIESSDIVKVDLQELAPYDRTIDGVKYHSLSRLILDNGWYGISYVINNETVIPGDAGLSTDDELIFADLYLYNPTNNDITFYVKQKVRTTVVSIPIADISDIYFYCRFGSANSPLTVKAGEKLKATILLSKLSMANTSQFAKYLIADLFTSSNQLLVSCLYKYSANNTPSMSIDYNQQYDEYGRLIKGGSSSRPILTSNDEGFLYNDTDLGKTIKYKGLVVAETPTFDQNAGSGQGAGGTPKYIANPFTEDTYAYFTVNAKSDQTGIKLSFCKTDDSEENSIEILFTQADSYRYSYAWALNNIDYPYIRISSDSVGFWGSEYTISEANQEWMEVDGTALTSYSVDTTGIDSNITIDNDSASVDINKPYLAELTPTSGYTIDSASVEMDGNDITDMVLSADKSIIYIPAVVGDLVITATATNVIPLINYSIDTTGVDSNITIDNAATSVGVNEPYMAVLTPTSGYTIDTITVTMRGNDVTNLVLSTDKSVIYVPAVVGNIVITATVTSA